MDIINGTVKLAFGRHNNRLLNPPQTKKLLDSFMESGLQRYLKENAIPIVVRTSWIETGKLSQDPTDSESIPPMPWTATALKERRLVTALGGRHRQDALLKYTAGLRKDVSRALDRMAKLGVRGSAVKEAGSEELLNAEKEVIRASQWLVVVYSKGKCLT